MCEYAEQYNMILNLSQKLCLSRCRPSSGVVANGDGGGKDTIINKNSIRITFYVIPLGYLICLFGLTVDVTATEQLVQNRPLFKMIIMYCLYK